MALPITYNIRNVLIRWKTTLLAIFGIALVVLVFMVLLGMWNGFRHALRTTGREGNAIVVQRGSQSELTSAIPKDQENFLTVDGRVKRDEKDHPLASPEMVTVVNLPHRHDNTPTNITLRGVTPMAFQVRGGIKIIAGRSLHFGLNEIIVGQRIANRIAHLDLDGTIRIQKLDWKIVGIFGADGNGFESEIWMDSKVLSQAFNRREMSQSITMRLSNPSSLAGFAEELKSDPKVQVEIKDERTYYEDQAGPIAERILGLVALVSTILGIGAVFGGMNTMYAIVSARTREIGTLRALGFSRGSILISFLVESVLLALAGGLAGCVLSLPANAMGVATGGPGFSEVAFAFRITPVEMAMGLGFAAVMGIIGGLLPAVRAARIPVSAALKET